MFSLSEEIPIFDTATKEDLQLLKEGTVNILTKLLALIEESSR